MKESYLKSLRKVSLCLASVIAFSGLVSGCAYRLGSPDRSLPGGYRQVHVPIFKNKSMEPGIEVSFTNAMIQEFERAKIGRVTEANQAEVVVEGVITRVTYAKSGTEIVGPTADGLVRSSGDRPLPTGTVLASGYQILVTADISLRRNSDKSVLWSGTFNGERTYIAPQVAAAGVNTVNPLYNLSARRQNIDLMAAEMMSEAHDRMTENF